MVFYFRGEAADLFLPTARDTLASITNTTIIATTMTMPITLLLIPITVATIATTKGAFVYDDADDD